MTFPLKSGVEEKALIKVRDIMRASVVTAFEDESVCKAAKLMAEHDVGSVVVVDSTKKPVGIITERDIVRRIIAKDITPSKAKIKDIMSHPLATTTPNASLNEAAAKMRKLGIRRLLVMEKEKIVGIISSTEILHVTPALMDALFERVKVGVLTPRDERISLTGYCEVCGAWSDMLLEVSGKFECEDCRVEAGLEE